MKRLRKIVFWLHLVVGLSVGMGVAMLAGTGMLMAFERQIIGFVERGDGAPPMPGATRLPVEALLAKARAIDGASQPSAITLHADTSAPAVVEFGRDRRVQLNAYTGEMTGTQAPRLRGFFRTVLELHRWLSLGGEWRNVGRGITRAASVGFLALIVSGLWLWFPRRFKWTSIKAVLCPNLRLRGKPRDWNWHNVLGFWAMIPLLAITLGGLVMSYTWANNLLYRAAGDQPPPPRNERRAEGDRRAAEDERRSGGGDRPRNDSARRPANYAGLDSLWLIAERHVEDWTSITLRLGGRRGENAEALNRDDGNRSRVEFVISNGTNTLPYNRTTLALNRETGAIISVTTFADQSPGRRWRALVLPIHRGEIFGVFGQCVAACACAATLVLVYTGFALAWRRLVRPLKFRRGGAAECRREYLI